MSVCVSVCVYVCVCVLVTALLRLPTMQPKCLLPRCCCTIFDAKKLIFRCIWMYVYIYGDLFFLWVLTLVFRIGEFSAFSVEVKFFFPLTSKANIKSILLCPSTLHLFLPLHVIVTVITIQGRTNAIQQTLES